MKSFKYSLFFLILILAACSKNKLTKVDETNSTELNAYRQIPEAPEIQNPELSDKYTLSQILENRSLFKYHIVGASCSKKNTALTTSQQLYKKGYPCRVIENNGKYRVIIQSFTNKKVALRELERLKKLNHKPDLWILEN